MRKHIGWITTAWVLGIMAVAAVRPAAAQAPAAPAAAQPAAAQPGPKHAEFQKIFAEWKKVLAELRRIQEEHGKADPAKKNELAKTYGVQYRKASEMYSALTAAAEAAFVESPTADQELGAFMIGVLIDHVRRDNYEEAARVAKKLRDAKLEHPAVPFCLGFASLNISDYDTAEELLKQVQKDQSLDALGEEIGAICGQFLNNPAAAREAWAKEQKIREAEAKADKLPRVLLKTTKGDIELELFENDAPNTVANFISLVEKKLYNGTPFHRVLPQFMAQGGDPKGNGSGGPGYTIPCECKKPDYRLHFRGSISMAHRGPDTGGSQFFLVFLPTRHLDGKHTVFGRIIKGMDVLAQLERVNPERPSGRQPDKILEAKVIRKQNHPYVPKHASESD